MTLLQLKYMLAIADAGSLNKAAEQLFVSQPALTSALHELENEIGITIFERTKRGIHMTNDGSEFLHLARHLYQQYELLESRYAQDGVIKQKFGVSAQHYSFVDKAFVETVKRFGTRKYDFAIRETKTLHAIQDVAQSRSEIGILYRSESNRAYLDSLFRKNGLEFHRLTECQAYVYIWSGHPLAHEESIGLDQLTDYPCLAFEQGIQSSTFLTEEILPEVEYPRLIHTNDRATMLNLMVGLNGYTLCSGIICQELNGDDYVAIPFREDSTNKNTSMEIGYICRKNSTFSPVGQVFLEEIRRYLDQC